MANKQDLLDEALSRGILTNEQRKRIAELEGDEANDNEERIKPVGTMNEIFVTFGVIMLTNAIGGLIGVFIKEFIISGMISAGVTWLVALWFHKKKRFRLPIIYCVISAAFTIALTIFTGLSGGVSDRMFSGNVPIETTVTALVSGLLILAVGAARFRIPFLMLPIAILFTITITYVARHGAEGETPWRLLLGGCGLTILAIAIFFDLKDPKRVTRWSDFAFWSFVIGSPLFVHSLFLSVLIQDDMSGWMDSPLLWMAMAALAITVTFIGVLLNRRALILSTLIYVSIVIFRILAGLALGAPATLLLITTLLIGLYVTALGSRWTRVRAAFMRGLPPSWTWVKKLPPY